MHCSEIQMKAIVCVCFTYCSGPFERRCCALKVADCTAQLFVVLICERVACQLELHAQVLMEENTACIGACLLQLDANVLV
jgi:hypothetical protein